MQSEYTNRVKNVFQLHEDPVAAAPMVKYMKNKFEYYGITSPMRKEISKQLLLRNELPSIEDVQKIARELWSLPQREIQYFTLEFLKKYYRQAPVNWIDLYEELVITKSWWDSVDGIAANQVGDHFRKFPELIPRYTSKWMESGNIWLQRTCLIFQLKYRDQTDFELMKNCIIPLVDEKEFFIRKAIGWALRQYGKFNPQAVINFVENQPMSNLSRREAMKHLS